MAYVLQVDFDMEGPFGEEMAESFEGLAQSINEEDGFIWKIWTEDEETKQAGGIYLFDTKAHAKKYLDMHTARLKEFGIEPVRAKIFQVNDALTNINHGPVK
ncbi:Putative mono-oxygenase ydhR [Alteribacillus persepolensis]|uniref:Putative mono-oxygenase ydhR n=1 Tax=Alteribacillus persepolensis TaxID=568899 RepID=A0A1G7Y6Y4_9BACI|nr:monooxygenase [Alteribacillus persepolensis]SDG92245.1 Putative mono-oxygenase ydhR [Alteribacillus persepolensis]